MSRIYPLAEWSGLPPASLSSPSGRNGDAMQSALTVRPQHTLVNQGRGRGRAQGSAKDLLNELLSSWLVLQEDWERLTAQVREEALQCTDLHELLALLVKHELLTEYQSARIENGKT